MGKFQLFPPVQDAFFAFVGAIGSKAIPRFLAPTHDYGYKGYGLNVVGGAITAYAMKTVMGRRGGQRAAAMSLVGAGAALAWRIAYDQQWLAPLGLQGMWGEQSGFMTPAGFAGYLDNTGNTPAFPSEIGEGAMAGFVDSTVGGYSDYGFEALPY